MPTPLELDRLRMVLVDTRNPLNLGAAARAMSNFGVLHLRVVNPYDPSFREARSAVGPSAEVLANAEQFESLAGAVADCVLVVGTTAIQHRELQHPTKRPDQAAMQILAQLLTANVAIVFGSEKTGLSNDDLSHCHWLMHIPARNGHLSMNLGQAVAVTLYEVVRESQPQALTDREEPATAAELERITTVLLEALRISGYTTPATLAATEEKARRMVRRMGLSPRDAEVLLGMLRQMLWKLRTP
ncbi:MAG TPA: TrmH family RNA methyltransferase [Candidatus Angelobacter sp.]|nr:TrmH family RNA methyltransferase [Candidatus Angelobacter sp.]